MSKLIKLKKPALVLRTCNADMTSHGGFKWPTKGIVKAPDWKPVAECGSGLHGLLWGVGDSSLLDWGEDAKWIVCEVYQYIKIDAQKIKFPAAKVVYCGDRKSATDLLISRGANAAKVVGAFVTVSDNATATAADGGTATAGDRGTATVGYGGIATAADRGTATAGHCGTATAGDRGIARVGDDGTATAGYCGTATAGDHGTATVGVAGTATAGDDGTATAGDRGIATVGDDGTATAGDRGTLLIRWFDHEKQRYRVATAYVGEKSIEPNVKYRFDNTKRQFVKA